MNRESINNVTKSKTQFLKHVAICNNNFRALEPSIYLYKKIIEYQESVNYKAEKIIFDEDFLKLIYVTLISWNMNMRGARMIDFNTFQKSIKGLVREITKLSKLNLHSLSKEELNDVMVLAKLLFRKLNVMASKSRIVGVSKTLHFLLPKLFPPMDRRYTMNFFYGHNKYFQEVNNEFNVFQEVFRKFYEITKKLQLTPKDINGVGWNTTIPKLIDNAIIGYMSLKKSEAK